VPRTKKKMANALCTLMGILDVVAGILIMFAFSMKAFAIIFGLIMIVKGCMSFI
jgi:uncharacterized membrane protein HdeD (DUF308 family)